MILAFDTETTGLPDFRAPSSAIHQPHLVQLAAILTEGPDANPMAFSRIVRPDGYTEMPAQAFDAHGISFERAMDEGIPLAEALDMFNHFLAQADLLVAHNINFDAKLMRIAFHRADRAPARENLPKFCTMAAATPLVNLPPTERMLAAGFNKPKAPSLTECIRHFFNEPLEGAHNALVDVKACVRLYFRLLQGGAQ